MGTVSLFLIHSDSAIPYLVLGYNAVPGIARHGAIGMSAEIKSHLLELLTTALASVVPNEPASLIVLERAKQIQFGDYSCAVAMQLARRVRRNPKELAQELVNALPASEWLESAGVAGAGFINLKLRTSAKLQIVTADRKSVV